MFFLRVTIGTPTPPELVGERLLPLLPADQFVALLIHFQPHPKTVPLALAVLGMFIIGIFLGPLYWLLVRWGKRHIHWLPVPLEALVAVCMTIILELLAMLLFWPNLQISVAGDPPAIARMGTLLSLLLTFGSALAVIALTSRWLQHKATGIAAFNAPDIDKAPPEKISRRTAFLRIAAITASIAALDGILFNTLLSAYYSKSNLSYEGLATPLADEAKPLTPPADFYVVSKNVIDPQVDINRWRLQIGGLIDAPVEWTFDRVKKLAIAERDITLECISNPVGGRLMSTAHWHGTSLQTVIDAVGGVRSTATHVVFTGVDSYVTSLPLKELLAAKALLAWEMDGAPLPARHGYPLRVIAPGYYGEQNPKWLTSIEFTDHNVKGFYQSQGWSAHPVETSSRIDYPTGAMILRLTPIAVSGIAFAGTRGISSVEVSADGGQTWHGTTLMPPQSDQSWVFWKYMWTPANSGTYTLVVRATDGTGALQTATQRGTVPNGATGRHQVQVTIA